MSISEPETEATPEATEEDFVYDFGDSLIVSLSEQNSTSVPLTKYKYYTVPNTRNPEEEYAPPCIDENGKNQFGSCELECPYGQERHEFSETVYGSDTKYCCCGPCETTSKPIKRPYYY